jgi:hypothetical protein
MLFLSTALAALLPAGAAFAAQHCDVPKADWQPRDALQAKLTADGWDVRTIKTENGCYEAYAIDAEGKRVEAYFDPKTLDRLGRDGEDADDDSRS